MRHGWRAVRARPVPGDAARFPAGCSAAMRRNARPASTWGPLGCEGHAGTVCPRHMNDPRRRPTESLRRSRGAFQGARREERCTELPAGIGHAWIPVLPDDFTGRTRVSPGTHRQSLPGAASEGARRGLCSNPDDRGPARTTAPERRHSGAWSPKFNFRLVNRGILVTPLHSIPPMYPHTRHTDVARDAAACQAVRGEGALMWRRAVKPRPAGWRCGSRAHRRIHGLGLADIADSPADRHSRYQVPGASVHQGPYRRRGRERHDHGRRYTGHTCLYCRNPQQPGRVRCRHAPRSHRGAAR